MNCVELQESLAEVEDGRTPEQRSHLKSCPECVALLQELDQIVAAAGQLRAADEPSPRVWNSIEIALRQEGLIRSHQSPPRRSNVAPFSARWGRAGWLVPLAAMILLSVGIYQHNRAKDQGLILDSQSAVVSSRDGLNDADLIQEVAANAPSMRGQYEENLRRVNDSIRDAQSTVDEDPNDGDARRALMDAYEQKSMLFEMAMDRPLP
jgi:hypothetical protein